LHKKVKSTVQGRTNLSYLPKYFRKEEMKVLMARKSWSFHVEVHYGNNGQIDLAARNE